MSLLLKLSSLKRSPKLAGIRKFTNLLYYDPDWVNVKLSNFDVVEVDGCRFHVTDQINAIQRVKGNDWFDRVRPTDVVVDIGANIGAMTIPLAKTAKIVYAVEPLFYRELEDNVTLNKLSNVHILHYGISKGNRAEIIEFGSKSAPSVIITFQALKSIIGLPINFLKMDGEGCEWDIEPSELKGIRELRIEFHISRDKRREHEKLYQGYLDWVKSEGYEIFTTDDSDGMNPYFIGHPEVRASLRR